MLAFTEKDVVSIDHDEKVKLKLAKHSNKVT